jgi:hypothetical protein
VRGDEARDSSIVRHGDLRQLPEASQGSGEQNSETTFQCKSFLCERKSYESRPLVLNKRNHSHQQGKEK